MAFLRGKKLGDGAVVTNIDEYRRWAVEMDARMKTMFDRYVRTIVVDVHNTIVQYSPVGKPETWKWDPPPGYIPGRFRQNWQITIGTPANASIDTRGGPPTGAKGPPQVGLSQVPGDPITPFRRYWITNNVAYGPRLERGYSQQAPRGFVHLAIGEAKASAGLMSRGIR